MCAWDIYYYKEISIIIRIREYALDGSYTFGYEAADGSFKIETKSATGEVKGREKCTCLKHKFNKNDTNILLLPLVA